MWRKSRDDLKTSAIFSVVGMFFFGISAVFFGFEWGKIPGAAAFIIGLVFLAIAWLLWPTF
jgi:hypothetical protein